MKGLVSPLQIPPTVYQQAILPFTHFSIVLVPTGTLLETHSVETQGTQEIPFFLDLRTQSQARIGGQLIDSVPVSFPCEQGNSGEWRLVSGVPEGTGFPWPHSRVLLECTFLG